MELTISSMVHASLKPMARIFSMAVSGVKQSCRPSFWQVVPSIEA
jgi:hypothetical protein